MKSIRSLMTLLMGAALAVGLNVAPASANVGSELPQEFEDHVRSVWTENGVPADKQDSLVGSLESGILLDAQRDGIEPIAVEEIRSKETIKQIHRFEDGSINVVTVDVVPEEKNRD